MKFSAAERTRPTLWDGVVALAVLAAALGLFFLFLTPDGGTVTARITLDGQLVAEYRLDRLEAPVSLPVTGAKYPITLELQPGRVRVAHSDCPGQDCVRTGWVSSAGGQLVCLPNRLIVSLIGGSGPDYDAITG